MEAAIAELGLSLRVAVVEGDDVMPLTDRLREGGLREAVSGDPLPKRLMTANGLSRRACRSRWRSTRVPTSSSPAAAPTARWVSAS